MNPLFEILVLLRSRALLEGNGDKAVVLDRMILTLDKQEVAKP